MISNRVHIDLPVSSGNSSGSDNWFYRDIKDIQKLPKAFSEVEEDCLASHSSSSSVFNCG